MIAGTGAFPPDRKSRLKRSHRLARVSMMVLLCPVVNGCTAGDTDTLSIADLPVFEIEQDLRIDGHEANLAPVQWLGVGPDGTIAVMQQLINGVRFFDSLGANKGVVGRDGESPGEFRRPNYAGWNGDTLWVSDQGLMRITLVSAEPVFLGTLPPISPSAQPQRTRPAFPHVHTFSFGLLN